MKIVNVLIMGKGVPHSLNIPHKYLNELMDAYFSKSAVGCDKGVDTVEKGLSDDEKGNLSQIRKEQRKLLPKSTLDALDAQNVEFISKNLILANSPRLAKYPNLIIGNHHQRKDS